MKSLYHHARIQGMYYHEYEKEILYLLKVEDHNTDIGSGKLLDPYASLAVAFANKMRRNMNAGEYKNYKNKEMMMMYENTAKLTDSNDPLFRVLAQCKSYDNLEF